MPGALLTYQASGSSCPLPSTHRPSLLFGALQLCSCKACHKAHGFSGPQSASVIWAPPLLPGLRPSCPGSAPPARAPGRLLPGLRASCQPCVLLSSCVLRPGVGCIQWTLCLIYVSHMVTLCCSSLFLEVSSSKWGNFVGGKAFFCVALSLMAKDYRYCSVTTSCPALCDPVGCSTPGSSVLHYLLELAQIHVL